MNNLPMPKVRAIPEETLCPKAYEIIRQYADTEDGEKIIIDAAKFEKLSNTFFCTSAGQDLCFLYSMIKQHHIDILEVWKKQKPFNYHLN